jgi:uncharacterized protein
MKNSAKEHKFLMQIKTPPFIYWLTLFSGINAVLMAAISLSLGDWSLTLISKIYLLFAMATQCLTLCFLLALIVYIASLFIKPVAGKKYVSIIFFVFAQLLIITNLKIYSLYHFHLNGMVLNLILGGDLLDNISFSTSMWLSILSVIGVTLLIQYGVASLSHFICLHSRKIYTAQYVACVLLAIISVQIINGFADAFAWQEISLQNRSIPWMHAATMRKQLARLGFRLNNKNTRLQNAPSALGYPLEPLNCNTQTPPNIVILVVDSLRADMLSANIMPHTAAIAEKSLRFNNHFSTGNSTRYGLFGLMYGLPGSYWNAMLIEEKGSLVFDISQSMHYQHFIYGSAKLTFPEFDRTVFSQLKNQLKNGAGNSSAEKDADITQRLIQDIAQADKTKPFFGFAFFDSPHAFSLPKNYPPLFEPMLSQVNYMALNNEYDGTAFFNRYKTTAHYVDSLIAQIYQELDRKKLLSNTIVIITSDHGQEFNETKQNYWGHNGNFSQWQTKVPFVIYWPNRAAHSTNTLSSHEDLVPTLLHNAFGCSTAIEKFSTGENLLSDTFLNDDLSNNKTQARSLPIESWTERAIRTNHQLYIFDKMGALSVVDENYQPQADQTANTGIVQMAMKKMALFTK